MKILIGQSYFRILDPKEHERNMPYPPLGALIAATMLRQEGHDIIFFDGMLAESTHEFISLMDTTNPDLVVIYDDEFNYLTKMCLSNMRDASCFLIQEAKKRNYPVLVYSSDATDFPQSYFNAGCDAIIFGEGEITLLECIRSIGNGSFINNRQDQKGLKYLDNGIIITNEKQRLINELDNIPEPDYSFADIESYRDIWINNHGYFSMNISTTRGCPYRCNWCAKPLYGQTYNSTSPRRSAALVKKLKDNYFVDHLWITDDIFGLKPGWVSDFADELERLNVKVPYKCLSRPDLLLRGNTINDLKRSGCEIIWVGAESGSQKILDAMDKGTTVEQIITSSKLVHINGMRIAFFIQFGYPGEVWEDISLTRKMIRQCLPDDIGISVSYPLPGTAFYEKVKKDMKDKTNWQDSADLDMMFTGTFERSFYKVLHKFVHTEYRIFRTMHKPGFAGILKLPLYLIRLFSLRKKLRSYLKNEQPYTNIRTGVI